MVQIKSDLAEAQSIAARIKSGIPDVMSITLDHSSSYGGNSTAHSKIREYEDGLRKLNEGLRQASSNLVKVAELFDEADEETAQNMDGIAGE